MQTRSFKDILALQTPDNRFLAFHIRNMELAEISNATWDIMQDHPAPAVEPLEAISALAELDQWNQEPASYSEISPEFKIKSLTINVTQICNLQCKYCAAGGDGTYGAPVSKISVEQTLPQIKFFMDKLKAGDSFSINFLGGEPLLYPLGMEMIGLYTRELGEQKGVEVFLSVTTNGTLFNEKTVATLKKLKCAVNISMDGSQAINDANRPSNDGKSTTEKIIGGLPALLNARSELGKLTFHGVFGKLNLDVLGAYKYFSQYGVDNFEFSYDHLEKSADINAGFMQQMTEVAELAFNRGGEQALRQIRFFDNIFTRLDNKDPVRHFCGSGQSYLMVDAKNNLYACPWDVGVKGEKVGQGLSLDHEKLAKYQGNLVEKNNCQTCWARNLCGGGCMYMHKNSTGNKNKVDTNFCDRTKHLLSLALLYYQRSRAAA